MRKFYLSFVMLALAFGSQAQQVFQKGSYTKSKQIPCKQELDEPSNLSEESSPKPKLPILGSAKSMTLWEQVIGSTTYDNQSNNSVQNRIIVDDQDMAHAAWTMSFQSSNWTDRGTGYNSGAGYIWGEIPYDRQENVRTGWPGLMQTGDGGEAFVCHTGTGSVSFAKRSSVGSGNWTLTTIPSDLDMDLLWPRAVTNGDTIHVITLSYPTSGGGSLVNGVDGNIIYFRSTDNGATWDIKDHYFEELVPTEFLNIESDSYAIDARDGKVSVAVFSELHDAVLLTSEDSGENWTMTIFMDFPIIGYESDMVTDVDNDGIIDTMITTDGTGSILIDANGVTHVSFGEYAFFDDTQGDSLYTVFVTEQLLYWNSTWPTDSLMIIGTFQESEYDDNETNDITAAQAPDYRCSLASMSSMAEDEDGNIYVVFAAADELFLGNQVFRHLYVTRSQDGGDTWMDQVELTPDIDVNEYEYVYPSVCKKVDGMLHIVAQRDFEPGLSVRGDEDQSNDNDIIYLAVTTDFDIVANVADTNAKPNFNLFPNPSNGEVVISGENIGGMSLSVHDKLGRELVRTKLTKSENTSLNFSELPSGVYTVTLSNGSQKMTKEMMIK